MIGSDRPIEAIEGDKLGRSKFSTAFAKSLLTYAETDCVVAAIYGDWGSGKSSAINMVIETIKDETESQSIDDRPIILNFNPWIYSTREYLIELFFKELSRALQQKNYGEKARDIGKKLEMYSNFFASGAAIPEPATAALSLIAKQMFSSAGKAAQIWGASQSKNIEETRLQIWNLMAEQQRKIFVVIDDIDRLTDTEICQMFQLVKAVGDFPNIVYLLAFDRKVVTKALIGMQRGAGEEYLEKIVQCSIELPEVSKDKLNNLLSESLDNIIENLPSSRFDRSYRDQVYYSGMSQYFRTVRNIKRYLNTLRLTFGIIGDEINPVDIIAMTAIQIFDPKLYFDIAHNKDIFTGTMDHHRAFMDMDMNGEITTARREKILGSSIYLDDRQAGEFLSVVFPNMGYDSRKYGVDRNLGSLRQDNRIAHSGKFDTYFTLMLPPGEIPRPEMDAILELANNKEAFNHAIMDLIENHRISKFLGQMVDFVRDVNEREKIQNIVCIFMDIGDLFPQDTLSTLRYLTSPLLMKLENQGDRFDIIKKAITDAENSIYTISYKVLLLGQENGRNDPPSDHDLSPEEAREVNEQQVDVLEGIVLRKIKAWAEDGRLRKNARFFEVLLAWKRLDKSVNNETKQYADDLIRDDEGLIDLVSAFGHQTTHGDSQPGVKLRWYVNLDNNDGLGAFIDINEIEPRLRKISESPDFEKLNEDQQRSIRASINILDGKVSGSD